MRAPLRFRLFLGIKNIQAFRAGGGICFTERVRRGRWCQFRAESVAKPESVAQSDTNPHADPINGNNFSLSKSVTVPPFQQSSFVGQFYGPAANEFGGVFSISLPDGRNQTTLGGVAVGKR